MNLSRPLHLPLPPVNFYRHTRISMSKKDIGRFDSLQYDCKKCGRHCDLEFFDHTAPMTKYMRQKGLCFHCAFWDKFENEPEKYEVVGGNIYEHGSPLFMINTKSGKVRLRYFIGFDRKLKKLHFSRFIGKVPEGMDIPDTGVFIAMSTFKRIENKENYQCRAIGCYDRYHCLYYDAAKMEPDDPWNKVPERHKVGSERCPTFINKQRIFTNKNTEQ